MNQDFDIKAETAKAVRLFWSTKNTQLKRSTDSANRGSVVGGKQLDGFLTLLRKACIAVGVPSCCIYDRNNHIPGFFRSSKEWDFIIISPSGNLLAAIELKSQVGSYGNNFNNRAEEAIGNATDFWTAYREHQFSTFSTPWVGFIMLIGQDSKSTVPVRNYENHYHVRPEFQASSYIDRYRILCEKLISERLYTSACLVTTENAEIYGNASDEVSIERFVTALQGFLIGCKDEFDN